MSTCVYVYNMNAIFCLDHVVTDNNYLYVTLCLCIFSNVNNYVFCSFVNIENITYTEDHSL